jgi:hypothetical protein
VYLAKHMHVATVYVCKGPPVRKLMDSIEAVAFAFDCSAKKMLSLAENMESVNDRLHQDMDRRKKRKTECDPRWAI